MYNYQKTTTTNQFKRGVLQIVFCNRLYKLDMFDVLITTAATTNTTTITTTTKPDCGYKTIWQLNFERKTSRINILCIYYKTFLSS